MRDLLKRQINAGNVLQNIRLLLHGEQRDKLQNEVEKHYKSVESNYQTILDSFFPAPDRDVAVESFKDVCDFSRQLFEQFFIRLTMQGTYDKQSFAYLYGDILFPDGIPELF